MPTLTVAPDTHLHFETWGQGPPLVLLNGLSQSTANWMSQRRRLADRFQVISYDARGQGRTPIGPTPLTLDVHTGDLGLLLDALSLPTATLCGFSFGARVGLGFTAAHPERVERLILTSLGAAPSALTETILRGWYEVLIRGGQEAMVWCALPHIFGERFLARHKEQLGGMIRASLHRNTLEGLRALLEGHQGFPDIAGLAAQVDTPTLVITADHDALVSPASARALVSALRHAEHLTVPDCGHTIPIEEPDVWRDAVVRFITSA